MPLGDVGTRPAGLGKHVARYREGWMCMSACTWNDRVELLTGDQGNSRVADCL